MAFRIPQKVRVLSQTIRAFPRSTVNQPRRAKHMLVVTLRQIQERLSEIFRKIKGGFSSSFRKNEQAREKHRKNRNSS
jgi:hypothetical protein